MTNVKYHSSPLDEVAISNNQIKKLAKTITIKTKRNGVSKTFVFGFLSTIVGICVLVIHPSLLYTRMKFRLLPDGEGFGLWLKSNVDVYFKMYIFNVTNKEAFLEGKEKLRVEEIGPYYHRLTVEETYPEFKEEEGTVTTIAETKYEWVPEMNNRSQYENFTLPNIPLLLFANQFSGKISFIRQTANMLIRHIGGDGFMDVNVKELMYGMESPYVKLGYNFVRGWIPFEKFGFVEQLIGNTKQTFTTYTGEKDYHTAGRIATYNNLTQLQMWEAPCNKLVGASDGKKFGNDLSMNETVYLYNRALCRSIPLAPAGSPTISNQGIPTVPYKILEDAFDNGAKNPENKCFCKNGQCLPRGIADLSSCYYGFPIALSYPHFYNCDPALLENVDGLKPEASLHESTWHINQAAGIPTNCSVKFQLNLMLKNISDIENCEKFANKIVPIAWAEIVLDHLDPVTALRIFIALRIFPLLEPTYAVSSLIVGIFCMFYELLRSMTSSSHDKTRKRKLRTKSITSIERGQSYPSLLTSR